jgi:hypothetical protein
MQAYPEGDVRSLSAAELLAGQGSSMVVFHPGEGARRGCRPCSGGDADAQSPLRTASTPYSSLCTHDHLAPQAAAHCT